MAYGFQPTGVNERGLTALIQNLGRDCAPTQFLREFTKNAIEAVQRIGGGRVEVDYNETVYEKTKRYKICFTDNGDGMTVDQMVNLLNNLSATGAINEHQNYGVGAKISALTRNHAGILYESWRDAEGHMVMLRYNDHEGMYGLQGTRLDNGDLQYAPKINDHTKPRIIEAHGTRVTLFGMEDEQDTMMPPEGVGGARESWIVLYLNSRFFRLPAEVEMVARVGYYRDQTNTKHNYLLNILGQKRVLDGRSEDKGELQVTGAKVYWWIMPKGADGHGRELLKGHTALINQDEIFDISDARSNKLAYFGIVFGRDQVVIYVEPERAVQNTARTGLVRADGSPLSWDVWQDEFRENMPPALKKLQDDLINEHSKDSHAESIRERLKGLKELFRVSRYRMRKDGELMADPDAPTEFGTGHEPRTDAPVNRSRPGEGAKPGALATSLFADLVDQKGVAVEVIQPDPFPNVQWCEETESLRDRAAEYLPPSNLIVANRDFQALKDLVDYFARQYKDAPELVQVIDDAVREAFEQVLIECVAGALSFKNRQHWNLTEFERAISREALTTAVMQRYWMVSHIKRILGAKLKGFAETPS